jgi:hypothetical protein
VRRAVLEHAERLAAQRSAHARQGAPRRWWNAVRELRWPAMVGSLAAAALAALVIAPQFLVPRAAPVVEEPRSATSLPAAPQPGPAGPAPPMLARSADAARAGGSVTSNGHPAPRAAAPAVSAAARMAGVAHNAGVASEAAAAPAARTAPAEPVVAADPAAAFRHAAETGDLSALQALHAGQASLDGRDPLGRTALMLATLHGQRDAVEMLLAWGADPNVADTEGTTPLGAAIAGRDTELAAMLKHYGAR